jgi:phosphatidylserine decarboxylase
MTHQYVERLSGAVMTEQLFADHIVNFLYSRVRENAPWLFRALTGSHSSAVLGYLNFDLPLTARLLGNRRFLESCGVNLAECLDPLERLNTSRKIFERRIRYWECRPMPEDAATIVAPADCRLMVGSLAQGSLLYLKEKFFSWQELLGGEGKSWQPYFDDGDFTVCRLTPDKYHYNHVPVSGEVLDIYTIDGTCHACNPGAVVGMVTPYSKNSRVVTIIDTDVSGGTGVGLVAMVEVVALMIGEVVQCYSSDRYSCPKPVTVGMFLSKGQPKSLYRPGSSTDVLLFQPGRICFAADIIANMHNRNVQSRFTAGFGKPLAETEVAVRSLLATRENHI